MLKLLISGDVEKFVTVTPKRVRLTGRAGVQLSAIVSIVPEKKYQFKIVGLRAKHGQNISYSLNEKQYLDVNGYMLTINNLKTGKGVYHDVIYLETDNKIQHEIKINIYGNIVNKEKNISKTGEL